jgi:hypothetical protein
MNSEPAARWTDFRPVMRAGRRRVGSLYSRGALWKPWVTARDMSMGAIAHLLLMPHLSSLAPFQHLAPSQQHFVPVCRGHGFTLITPIAVAFAPLTPSDKFLEAQYSVPAEYIQDTTLISSVDSATLYTGLYYGGGLAG